jgi:hypothetical protein
MLFFCFLILLEAARLRAVPYGRAYFILRGTFCMKKFFYGMIALSVSLFFVGCETEVEVPGDKVTSVEDYDAVARNLTDLAGFVAEGNAAKTLALTGDVELTAALTIPAGKEVYLFGGSLETGAFALTVEGKLFVKKGDTLTVTTSTGSLVVPAGGAVSIEKGTLVADAADAVVVEAGGDTALGTNVVIKGGTLQLVTAITAVPDAAVFGYVSSGALTVTTTTLKPSAFSAVSVPAGVELAVATTANEDSTADFTVPVRVNLVTTGTLSTLTGNVTINGTFTATELTVATEKTLTVNGMLIAAGDVTVVDYGTEATAFSGGGLIVTIMNGTFEGYTIAVPKTVAAVKLAITVLKADAAKLADDANLDLDTTFGTSSVTGIGSVTVTATTATVISAVADGVANVEKAITLTSALAGTLTGGTVAGTDNGDLSETFTLSLVEGKVAIADAGWASGNAKVGAVPFEAVQLSYDGVVSPVLDAFNIGVKTDRGT